MAPVYPGTVLKRGSNGPAVRTLQARLNQFGNHLQVDGVYGPGTEHLVRVFQAHRGLAVDGQVGPQTWARLWQGGKQPGPIAHSGGSLQARAWAEAGRLLGVMEHGGNNSGIEVSRIIRANGGGGPEPWCGDFVAYCYRLAGSKAVTRSWASVAALRWVAGVRVTSNPERGDLVRYVFDHVGLFGAYLGNGQIGAREGNTGPSGAVSDSSTGGDGVYEKHRATGLVRDYLHVTR